MNDTEKDIIDETLAEEECQTAVEEKAEKKSASKKLSRKEKKEKRLELRKQIRMHKKDAYNAKGPVGKICYRLWQGVHFLFIIAVIATVFQVNYNKVIKVFDDALRSIVLSYDWLADVSPEDVAHIVPKDEEGDAAIAAMPMHDEGEDWAIYVYMVGSNLEAESMDQLTVATRYFTQYEASRINAQKAADTVSMMTGAMQNMQAKGMDLPDFMYEKVVSNKVTKTLGDYALPAEESEPLDYYAASKDIKEMLSVDLPENVKMVIQPGGAGSWGYEKINPNRLQRFVYDSEGMYLVDEQQVRNMGDKETLEDFLRYCKENHPADHTMIIFWNHGGGAFGYGTDMLFGSDGLSLEDMRQAFENVYESNENNPPIDVIGFDACLMASMEVANTFNGFAEYLLGSEDVEPGDGWDYTAWLNAFVENPRINGAQVGKAVADSYIEFYTRLYTAYKMEPTQLFSVIDLKYADDIYEAYSEFAAAALKDMAQKPNVAAMLGQAANRSIKYAGAGHSVLNTLDLAVFMEEAAELYPEETKKVIELVDKAVIYNVASDSVRESRGLTVFYPATIRDLNGFAYGLDYVTNICQSPDVAALYYYKIAGCLDDEMQNYVQKQGYGEIKPMDTKALKAMENAQITILEDGNYVVQTNEEVYTNAQSIGYNLYQLDGNAAKYLGCSSFVLESVEGNLQTAYDGTWLYINDQLFELDMLSYTGNTLTFTSEVYYTNESETLHANLLLGYDFDEAKWSILGVHEKADDVYGNDYPSRSTIELKYGHKFSPVYTVYDLETGAGSRVIGDEIRYDDNVKIEEKKVPNGQYISYLSITDARGDVFELPMVSFEIKNGKIVSAELFSDDFLY